MLLKPRTRGRTARIEALHQLPKTRAVVHLYQMCNLMCDDISEYRRWGQDQSPAEGEVPPARAAAPPAFRIAHIYSRDLVPDPRSQPLRAPRELCPCSNDEMVAHPACQMRWFAGDPDFTIGDADRRRRGIVFAPDPVGNTKEWNDCTFDEWRRLRQRLQARCDPFPLRRQKSQPRPRRNPARQNKFDPALGCIDPQPDPSRLRADPDRYRNADFWIAVENNRPQVTSQVRHPTSSALSDASPVT